MKICLKTVGFQRKKSKLDQNTCFELNGRFSTSSETLKDQNIILAAYIPAFSQCYISERCLKTIINQAQTSPYQYSCYTEVRLFFELEEIRRKRSGKLYGFSMLFKIVPTLPFCGAIVAGKYTDWPGSSEYTDRLRDASQKGHLSQRHSWALESIRTFLTKSDCSGSPKKVCVRPAKVHLKQRSDLQAEIGSEDRLSAQSTSVTTFQSHFDSLQTSQHSTTEHAASNPRIIVDESYSPSLQHQYPYDPSCIYSNPPRNSTIPFTPFEHSQIYLHDTTTHPTTTTALSDKRDSAITNSFHQQQETHEKDTSNSALTSGTSLHIDIRTEPRRNSYRTIQQHAEFLPIEEEPSRQAKNISRKIGDIKISEPAATTAEELAFLRANDPHWTWDEDTERFFRMHAKTGKVVWFGDGT